MSLGTDARYQRLADQVLTAWSVPGSGRADVKRAVLAQWTCEQAGGWPPTLNNPGYVTLGALASVGGVAATGAVCGKQYPRFCLARFPTPDDGARAYALLILRGRRYQPALDAARAGHGLQFLNRVTAAGYGTRQTCVRSAYARLGGSIPAVTGGRTANADTAAFITPSDLADKLAALLHVSRTAILTADQAATAAHWLSVNGYADETESLAELTGNTLDAWAVHHRAGGPLDPIAGAIAGLVDGIAGVGRNLLLLGFALVALLLGLWIIATADDGGPAPRLV